MLAHAARHQEFRSLAATFWSGTRGILAQQVAEDYRQAGEKAPVDPKHIAIAFTALDIGLVVQHLVDPELYEALFAPLAPGATEG